MRVFSKLVFICNICFVASVVLRFVEVARRNRGNFDSALPVQPLQSTLVVLGYSAIFLNFIFLAALLTGWVRGKKQTVPRWLFFVNLIFFSVQVWYFFYS
jgi:hypothetical protein